MDSIYDDLDDGPPIEIEYSRLQKDNAELHSLVRNLEADVLKMSKEIAELKSKQFTLEENMSSLFKTARNEIERKNRIIEELNRRIDDLASRRDKSTVSSSSSVLVRGEEKSRHRSRSPMMRFEERGFRGRGRDFGKWRRSPIGRRSSPSREFYGKRGRFNGRFKFERGFRRDRSEFRHCNQPDYKINRWERNSHAIDENVIDLDAKKMDCSLEEGELLEIGEEKESKSALFPPLRRVQPQFSPEPRKICGESIKRAKNELIPIDIELKRRENENSEEISRNDKSKIVNVQKTANEHLVKKEKCADVQKPDENRIEEGNNVIREQCNRNGVDSESSSEKLGKDLLLTPLTMKNLSSMPPVVTPLSSTPSPVGKVRPKRRNITFKMLN